LEIVIHDLSKIYPNGNRALLNLNLKIGHGIFGLLGPNGAGKSTLMRILVMLMEPSSGMVTVNGMELARYRKEIRSWLGYLPQDFHFFPKLRSGEFLDYMARLSGMKNRKERSDAIERILEEVGLFEARDRMASKLSGGMKRRLGIAQALIHRPKILVIDEPTTGLDPEERIRFRNLLSEISAGEVIIILSTHIVGDISSTCSHMALLNKGEIAFSGSPEELIHEARGHVWLIRADDEAYHRINARYPVISTVPSKEGWAMQVVAEKLEDFKGEPVEPNLEHAYVHFMENKLKQQLEDRMETIL